MSPAQPLMDVEADCKPNINALVVPEDEIKSSKENLAMKGLSCSSNRKDSIIGMEDLINEQNKASEDVDIDKTESRNNYDFRLAENEDPDATEYSSSFDGSEAENCSGFSEGEVESELFGDGGFGSSVDAFGSVFQMRCVHSVL